LDDEDAAHLTAAIFGLETAVKRKRAGLVGAELERHRRIRADALGNPVIVDGQAVRDVAGLELDLHQVVLIDLDPRRLEGITVRTNRERLGGWRLILNCR